MIDTQKVAHERGARSGSALREFFCYACNRLLARGPWDALVIGKGLEIRCGKCRTWSRLEGYRPPE
jgi:phage FluMu protein Com